MSGLKSVLIAFVFLYAFHWNSIAWAQASISEEDVVEVLSGEKKSDRGTKAETAAVPPSHRVSVSIQFKAGRAEILKDSHVILGAIGKSMTSEALKHMDFLIIVYTEASGAKQEALNLALKRALGVKKMMTASFSVSSKRLQAKAMVDMQPDSDGTSNAPETENTSGVRVDFVVIEE